MIDRNAPLALINSAIAWFPQIHKIPGYVAGGFIRAYYSGEQPKDMDIYFHKESDIEMAEHVLRQAEWEKVFESDRALSYQRDRKLIQLIKIITGPPSEVIQEFDFTVCSAALELKATEQNGETEITGTVLLHDDFFEHLAARVVVFTGSRFPLASLARAFKYVKKGYHICDENIIRLASDVAASIDWTNEQEVESQIDGMDPEGNRRIRAID